MATVYIEINPNYSRTIWDPTGGANYTAGDRVSYDDGANDLIFVCLVDNNSTTTPNNDSTNWVAAGSKDFPFQTKGILAFAGSSPNGFPSSGSAQGELSLNEYDNNRQNKSTYPNHPTNFAYQAAGPGGTIIFGDGDYATPTGASGNSFGAANVTLKSLNFQKATLLTPYGFTVSGGKGPGQSNGPLVIEDFVQYRTYYSSGSTDSDATNTVTFRDCYITDQHPQSTYQSDATSNTSNGGAIANVLTEFTFFYNCTIVHKRYYVNYLCYSGTCNAENCTFYVQVASGSTGYSLFSFHNTTKPLNLKKCIIYVKHFYKSLSTNAFFGNTPSESLDEVSWFVENNYTGIEIQAGSSVSYSDDLVRNVDPLFVDADNNNLSLRPNSSLIGGFKKNKTSGYDKVLYITPAASNQIKGEWEAKTNANLNPDWSAGHRCSYNGEVYEALVDHNTDGTSTPPDQDTTNWRLVPAGDINDPYRATDLGPSVLDTLTDNSVIFMLDGDYPAFPICYNAQAWNGDSLIANYPQNGKPLLTPINKDKVTISANNFAPGNILCKNIEMLSPRVFGSSSYPDNIGFHFSECILHTGQWWPPANCITENCLIFANGISLFYASLGSTNNPAPDSKGIQFINNTVIRSVSNGYFMTSLINQGLKGCLFKNNIFYAKSGSTFTSSNANLNPFLLRSTFIDNAAFDETRFVNTGYTDDFVNLDPKFINPNGSTISDFRLRPNSPLIGGIKKDPTDVYYLQPGNPYNGDGTQKDASSMTADGDPGPFNNFKEIVAAGVPYGSTVVIVNGTYAWPNNFNYKFGNSWELFTYEGYHYIAETANEVIFDANKQQKYLGYQPYGGTPGSGAYLDLDTSFTGIQFNNVVGVGENNTRNQVFTRSSNAGFGSCTFNSCKFLGWINTADANHPWTGGGRSVYGSTMHWKGCTIVIAFDYAGSLLGGGDGFADDAYHGPWSWENCTFYIPVGLTTFNGRNAVNGTYQSPGRLFGSSYNQSQRTFKNNILYIPGGNTSTGTTSVNNLPAMQNNCLVGVVPEAAYFDFVNDNNIMNVDPKFVGHADNNFLLRPNSPLIGRG